MGKSSIGFADAGYEENHAYIYATLCFFGGGFLMILLNKGVAKLLGERSHLHAGPVPPVPKRGNRSTQASSTKDDAVRQDGVMEADDNDEFVENLPLPRTNDDDDDGDEDKSSPQDDEDQRRLIKMGLNTALAIGLHNFPEGLATFVAALDDPSVGAVLAIAIAIHNIPEGLCVALPIYYATGNRWKAFLWALL